MKPIWKPHTCLKRMRKKMAIKYKKETGIRYRNLKEHTLTKLPPFCRTYFIGEIDLVETTAASYAYIYDDFFKYLKSKKYFNNKEIASYTLDDLAKLTTSDMEEYFSQLKELKDEDGEVVKTHETSTVQKYKCALSSLWVFFVEREMLPKNPLKIVKRGKKNRKMPICLSDKEKEKLFASIDTGMGMTEHQKAFSDRISIRDRTIFQILLDTGVRVSELVGMDISDINHEEMFFNVIRKGGNQQKIYFSDETEEILQMYLSIRENFNPPKNEKALFLSSMGTTPGKRLSPRSVQLMTKKYIAASNPELYEVVTPHKMRSTFATDVLVETSDLALVADLLGHASMQTTQIYAKYNNDKIKASRNILQERRKKTKN